MMPFAGLAQPLCPFHQQLRSNWCWAACIAMVVESLDRPRTQVAIAAGVRPSDGTRPDSGENDNAGEAISNRTRRPQEIDALWSDHGIAARRYDRALTRDELNLQIVNAGRPVMLWLERRKLCPDHVVLVAGKCDADWFLVADPSLANYTVATYDELLAGRGGWTRTWVNL